MSDQEVKLFPSLQISDLMRHPVWESIIDNEADEVSVFPVTQLPVSDLGLRTIGTRVKLANGNLFWAMILYLDTKSARKNEQFITLRIEKDGEWFWLSRYWDVDYEYSKTGPGGLAKFLGLSVDEVFPISYDVREFVVGDPAVVVGTVSKEPRERLPVDEIIRMAVP